MKDNNLFKIILTSAITAVVAVVALKLMGYENPTTIAGGIAGGVTGGLFGSGALNKKS